MDLRKEKSNKKEKKIQLTVRETVSLLDVVLLPRIALIDQLSPALDLPSEGVAHEVVSGIQALTRAWKSCGFSAVLKKTRCEVCFSVKHDYKIGQKF